MINKEVLWYLDWWKLAQPSLSRRPSALMLTGPKGMGKTGFAQEIAASWLCRSPLENGSACGQCVSCGWMATAQHPDFRWVRPDADADDDAAEDTPEAGGAEATADPKKKSQEIRIEQIRALSGFAHVGSHRGGLRIVLISPANRMNYAAANALLKNLEEPADALIFLLVADSLNGIPATILSRCRRLALSLPEQKMAEIVSEQSTAAAWLIPLLASAQTVDPIKWAEKAGKTAPADSLWLMLRWMTDAARVRQGLSPRTFPDQMPGLRQHALAMRSPQAWAQTMAELQRLVAHADHPLNPKLFYESIFDRLRRCLV